MLSALVLAASALAASPATPPALVVWMAPSPPEGEARKHVERETGPAEHRAWADITLTPEPAAAADETRIAALNTVLKEGRERWNEFDSESGIARALAAAIDPIAVLTGPNDKSTLLTALLWEGAGITRGYPENLFASLQDTSAFRVSVAGKSMVRPWVDAIALDPKHVFERTEFPDGQSFAKVAALQSDLALLPRAHLVIDVLPTGTQVVVDGSPVAEGARDVELSAGHHFAHVLAAGQIAERMEFDVAPGDTVPLRALVSPEELVSASASVLNGSAEVPADVATGVRSLAGRIGTSPRVFLGTVDEKGKPRIVAFSGGAVITKKRPVTFLFVGELGGGVLESSGFSGNQGQEELTYQFGGSLGFELGIYNAAIYGSGDIALSPSVQMPFGTEGGTTPEDNEQTSAFFRPNGGVGVYLPRPLPGKVWFLLGANYGWFAPSSAGPGVKLSVGIPLKNDSQTWLRITLDGYRGDQLPGMLGEGTQTSMASLRIGFGSLM
ncbi:hypothetical protein LBMAG42_34080 [Deltaproteobacteria bacterium]|nr:hypothetical protein LBMAG42_34080 [Deltaproteobacteria bacterium]